MSIMLLMSMLNNVLPSELIKRPMLGNLNQMDTSIQNFVISKPDWLNTIIIIISGVYYDMMFMLVSAALAVSSFISTVSSKSTGPSPPPSILKTVGEIFHISSISLQTIQYKQYSVL